MSQSATMVGRRVLVDLRSRGQGTAAGANAGSERAPQIDETAPRIGLVTPGEHRAQVKLQGADGLLRLDDFDRRHLLEVLGAEDFGGRPGEAQRDFVRGLA